MAERAPTLGQMLDAASQLHEAMSRDARMTAIFGDGPPRVVFEFRSAEDALNFRDLIVPFSIAFGAALLNGDPEDRP